MQNRKNYLFLRFEVKVWLERNYNNLFYLEIEN